MSPLRVLVVDDDAGLRSELRQLLEEAGYEVVGEAGTGAQGVARARADHPHVVISDLRMPGDVGGLELAEQLRGEVPVILLSAYDDAGLQARAREVSATFLVKGCRSRSIFAALEHAALAGASVPG